MQLAVLAVDGAFDTGLSVLLDTFAFANELAPQAGCPDLRFDVRLVGTRSHIQTGRGMRLSPDKVTRSSRRPDYVLVPATSAKTPEALAEIQCRRDVTDAHLVLQGWAERGTTVCAACTGTFTAAAAQVLDGHRATTAWWLGAAFRERFPRVKLDESKMVVDDGPVVTAGAAFGHADLALWLIRTHSPALSTLVGRYLLVDDRPSQVVFAVPDHLHHNDPIVDRFETWVREHLEGPLSIEAGARAVGTSPRSLERRMREVMGRSPIAFVRDLRVEVAVHRLRTTDESLAEIAAAVGYQDATTLRRLIRAKLGKGVVELRQRRDAAL